MPQPALNIEKGFPVVGVLKAGRQYLPGPPSGFLVFHTAHVHGQCRVDGTRIDFLNVVTEPHWRGHFRRFVRELCRHYKLIRMWSVDGAVHPEIFRAILAHYGFVRGHDCDKFGEMHEVWDLHL